MAINESPVGAQVDKEGIVLTNARANGANPVVAIIGFVMAWAVLAAIIWLVPTSKELTVQGRAAMAIMGWVIIIWVTDALPKSISGLGIPLLLILTGAVQKVPEAFSGFTKNESFLVMGAFILAAVMMVTRLDRRIALGILSKVKPKVNSLLGGFFIAHIVTALLVPATVARAGMFLPIVKGINQIFDDSPASIRARKALAMSAIGFAAVFAAPVFLTGHMPNVIMSSLLNAKENAGFTWGKWLWLHWPMLGLFPLMFLWVTRYFRLRNMEVPGGLGKIKQEKESMGKMSPTEWVVLACFTLAVLLWATGSFHKMESGVVTILVVALLFVPGLATLSWKDVQQKTMWGTWLLLVGALSLVDAFNKTGVDKWMAKQMASVVPPWGWMGMLLFVMILVQVLRLGIISNVGAVTLMAPIIYSMAPMLKLNSVSFTLAVLNVDTYALLLPMEVTACLIAYGSDEFTFADFFKVGAPLTLLAILYITFVMVPWWAFTGYPIWRP